jgi:hypothetical protein
MIFIKYKTGRTLQGILLALGDQLIRVAVKGADDAVQFRLVNGVWVSEDCEIVTFEFADRGFSEQDDTECLEAMFPAQSQQPALPRVM